MSTSTAAPVRATTHPDAGATAPGVLRLPRERVALALLLGSTALLYLWGLGASGWANSFYSAAVQAGSESWKAFFFGSSDAASSITVDKTPLSLWPMMLSVRAFGLSSWAILVPQALMGVGAVALLHALVRRATGSAGAGLLAGAVLALTPVAVLMFRFNNPDAMLVLLLVAAAYAVQRALEGARPVRWIALAGALVGLAFLAKMLQAFLVLPAFALAYALFAAVPPARRVGHLLLALASMVLAGGWWVAIVELWPASSRPWIGGSQGDSVLELTLGYNGLGRITGEETGSVGGAGGWGETGALRLLGSEIGGQVAWLLPAAVVLGATALALTWRRGPASARGPRSPRVLRGTLAVWLGWLVVTAVTFSFMGGIFHAYYTVALAPAIAALVGIGAWSAWSHRDSLLVSGVLATTTALTASLAFVLLDRAGDWHPWLKYVVAAVGALATLALAGVRHLPRRAGRVVAAAALVAALAGPTAYALSTAATPHTGSIPTAGPTTTAGPGGTGGPAGMGPGGMGGPGTTGAAPGASTGGLLEASTSSEALDALLTGDADSFTWVAAAVGSNTASGYQLATQEPVMAIGGFNGSDPSPTLAEFQQYVADGEIHWFIGGGGTMGGPTGGVLGGAGGSDGGSDAAAEITAWVESTFTAQSVDGVSLYDLSAGVE